MKNNFVSSVIVTSSEALKFIKEVQEESDDYNPLIVGHGVTVMKLMSRFENPQVLAISLKRLQALGLIVEITNPNDGLPSFSLK